MSKQRIYGYGVVDCDGERWFKEHCMCMSNKDLLEEEIEALNADKEILGVDEEDNNKHVGFEPPAPYRVVRLYYDD